jgi:aspartate dehydrogenase
MRRLESLDHCVSGDVRRAHARARTAMPPFPIGLIGFGRIARRIAANLPEGATLTGVLSRRGEAPRGVPVVATLDALLALGPRLIVECAAAEALAAFGPEIVARGVELIPLSLAALADDGALARLEAATRVSGAGRVSLAPGAIGSLDALAAAREAGLTRVLYRGIKPPYRWRPTAVAGIVDLDAIIARRVVFRGSVREAGRLLPRHLNVTIGIALAGLGLDRTEVELVADPAVGQLIHELEFDAPPGSYVISTRGIDVDETSDPADYTAFTVVRLVRHRLERFAP